MADPPFPPPRKRQRTQPSTIYAATAGHTGAHPTHRTPLSPADVLTSKFAAPPRYAEPQLDWWAAHRWLPARTRLRSDVYSAAALASQSWTRARLDAATGGRAADAGEPVRLLRTDGEAEDVRRREEAGGLPDGELCAAVHRYVAAFYAVLERGDGRDDGEDDDDDDIDNDKRGQRNRRRGAMSFHSFDETALLALAILLEETTRSLVRGQGGGGEGWRALTVGLDEATGREVGPNGGEAPRRKGRRRGGRGGDGHGEAGETDGDDDGELASALEDESGQEGEDEDEDEDEDEESAGDGGGEEEESSSEDEGGSTDADADD